MVYRYGEKPKRHLFRSCCRQWNAKYLVMMAIVPFAGLTALSFYLQLPPMGKQISKQPTQGATKPKVRPTKPTKLSSETLITIPELKPIVKKTSTICNHGPAPHPKLADSPNAQLRKVAEYEQACGAAIVDRASFFIPTPTTTAEANDLAIEIAATLTEFRKHGIAPLVFFEPTHNGATLDLKAYSQGIYDQSLDTFFAALKVAGIDDQSMGTWVPIPEGNIPVWGNTNPQEFTASVAKAALAQKKHFPTSKTAVLLDTTTYPSGVTWEKGEAKSLKPYLANLPAGLIDSFGLQGFPWIPPANIGGPSQLDPTAYLRIDIAREAAQLLGTKQVWFNTGTFGRAHAGNPATLVTVSPEKRQELLKGVVSQAVKLKASGVNVSIHLFAENKSMVAEGNDWSYWTSGMIASSPATPVFKSFAHNMQATGIPLWLYDSAK